MPPLLLLLLLLQLPVLLLLLQLPRPALLAASSQQLVSAGSAVFRKKSTMSMTAPTSGTPGCTARVRQEARRAGRVAAGSGGRRKGVQMALVGYRDSVLVVMRAVATDSSAGADGGAEAQGKGAGVAEGGGSSGRNGAGGWGRVRTG